MTGIIDALAEDEVWRDFRDYKIQKSHMSARELKRLTEFIEAREYLPVAERIVRSLGNGAGKLDFPLPVRREINKSGSLKKRVIYSYPETETLVLKLIATLLYRYDDLISPACYSFRQNSTAKRAISDIRRIPGLSGKYVYKADIHNYFNSIPSEKLAEEIRKIITDDEKLAQFLTELVMKNEALVSSEDEAGEEPGPDEEAAEEAWADEKYAAAEEGPESDEGFAEREEPGPDEIFEEAGSESGKAEGCTYTVVRENRGAMAGVPVSAFFANIYLRSLDDMFTGMKVPYFRYSDDILIFADSREELDRYVKLFEEHIEAKGLEINPDKVSITGPGESWEFLGFAYRDGQIDLADSAVAKMKAKIKRKANALYRWRRKKNVDFEHTAMVMLRIFNTKYFDETGDNDFTWSRWFFPALTTTDGLHELDTYLVQYLRFLNTGRHSKINYRVNYDMLKQLGYRSLVNEYYRWKAEQGPAGCGKSE